MRFEGSGIVMDDNGSTIANAEVWVENDRGYKQVTTSTDAGGHYEMAFETAAFGDNFLIHAGGGEYEHYYVQARFLETARMVRNLRLRRPRTFEAGQPIVVSIDPDSSVAYDGEDSRAFDMVWDILYLHVADAGTLTIDARPVEGDILPQLAVSCVYDATDNCLFDWVKPPRGSSNASLSVKANSRFQIRVSIPHRAAPQRYVLATSLQR